MTARGPLRGAAAATMALGLTLGLAVPASAESAAGTVSDPIVSGLIGPLGLALGPNGTIFVAEGFIGQLTRFNSEGGARKVLVSGGDSLNGVEVTFGGRALYTLSIIPEEEEPPTDTTLNEVRPSGATTTIASLLDHEVETNPDGDQTYGFVGLPAGCAAKLPPELLPYTGIVESNPYKVAVESFGSYLVADAAGNSIVRVGRNGGTATVAILPPVPQRITFAGSRQLGLPLCTVGRNYLSEPVPTDVEIGPDGDFYVTSLPGGLELPGYGSVFRIDSDTRAVTRVATGLSGAVDLAVADDGTIYVAELFANRISSISNGVVSTVVDVFTPGAVEIADDGTIYATVGVFAPAGDVVIVTP